MLRYGGSALSGMLGIIPAQTEDVPGRRWDRRQQPRSLQWIGELSPGQLLDGLMVHQAFAVFPGLADQTHGRLASTNHIEEALGKSAAAASQRALLSGEVTGEAGKVQHGVVPDGTRLR